jgi:hypothetical protein
MSKYDQGLENARKLEEYLALHEPAGTLPTHNGRINKSAVAEALGFGRSVWAQNPQCRTLIQEAEARHGATPIKERAASTRRVSDLEQRLSKLEARVAVLTAENAGLRTESREKDARLKALGWLDDAASGPGRLPW